MPQSSILSSDQGGGGVKGGCPTARKQSGQLSILVLNLQFTEGSSGFITKKTVLFQGSRGGPTFSRRGEGGGPNANFYRNP